MNKKAISLSVLLAATFLTWIIFANPPQQKVQSRAYKGHESDKDIQNFVQQYPKTAGTRLDDCQTCHRSGVEGTDTAKVYSQCGYCHLTQYPNARYKTGIPAKFEDTLNAYGLEYKKRGRNSEALAAIAKLDSDGDGASNADEIAALRYPGDSDSKPKQPLAPARTITWADLQKLPHLNQFLLMNTSSEPFDDYASYAGIKIKDLLQKVGVKLDGVTGITIFAPDGYSIDCTIDDVNNPYPKAPFYAAPQSIADKERAFVQYPASIPAGIADGKEIPTEPWLLLAFERDGKPLDISRYDKGRLAGEGPYRLIIPQKTPARPDRSVKSKTYGDGWDYDKSIDHNAGACVRGVTVIRVNPMPDGFEQYDWKNGWPLIAERKIVIFGKNVAKK
jgi:cytochrome c553